MKFVQSQLNICFSVHTNTPLPQQIKHLFEPHILFSDPVSAGRGSRLTNRSGFLLSNRYLHPGMQDRGKGSQNFCTIWTDMNKTEH